ncbi:MAG: M23 family metallopeptidase [Muribaculaceae bacterium]|nr:M23 family metallopeptidase [Muribaculaceae bacterium]
MKSAFYRYNPATSAYERVYPSPRRRLWAFVRQYVLGAAGAVVIFIAAYYLVDFPRERSLRQQKEMLENELEALGRQADEAISVMEDIAARDNNFYRVVMQAEPLTMATRLSGMERERQLEQLDSLRDNELVHNVSLRLDQLDHLLYHQIKSFDYLNSQASLMADRLTHIPSIQPISSKHMKTMASGYGYRSDPIYGTSKFHEGMDFSAAIGTPVYATGDGTVRVADWESGYGNCIDIDHGFNYLTRYAHLSQILVRPGQAVKRGDLIGKVGNTGKSTGPHLHYEVRFRGQPQNPVNYYFMDLTPDQYDEMIRQSENAGHVMD